VLQILRRGCGKHCLPHNQLATSISAMPLSAPTCSLSKGQEGKSAAIDGSGTVPSALVGPHNTAQHNKSVSGCRGWCRIRGKWPPLSKETEFNANQLTPTVVLKTAHARVHALPRLLCPMGWSGHNAPRVLMSYRASETTCISTVVRCHRLGGCYMPSSSQCLSPVRHRRSRDANSHDAEGLPSLVLTSLCIRHIQTANSCLDPTCAGVFWRESLRSSAQCPHA